ncbi:leucine-rich receptor-like protein kinase [Perkinsela sp. CCAP 1560/4]|nr:leucine-rich receptor-like protein kinase [Perkinsela sp. CCAP 1560/4]|eukprot:KNH06216.1 leucine-rich receptor-like protein kinase [Perkinsela sp. CCAP 1560/4]
MGVDLPAHRSTQATLVHMLFDLRMRNPFTGNRPGLSICDWEDMHVGGISRETKCTDGILYRIILSGFVGWGTSIFIEYVPPTVEVFKIERCSLHHEFNARVLPRDAVTVSLVLNRLYGNPRLSGLPRHIEELDLSHNALCGQLFLVHLPKRIRLIDLSRNNITSKSVLYKDLPASLTVVRIDHKAGRIHPPRLEEGLADVERIFERA